MKLLGTTRTGRWIILPVTGLFIIAMTIIHLDRGATSMDYTEPCVTFGSVVFIVGIYARSWWREQRANQQPVERPHAPGHPPLEKS